MALIVPHLNLVRMTVASAPGQADFELDAAVSGFLSMAGAGAVDGRTYSYGAEGSFSGGVATKREVGRGVYTASGTGLSRATVLNSTAGGTTKENFSVDDVEVVITPLADDVEQVVAASSVSVALTDAATIAVDWSTGIVFNVTLTTSRILGNPSNGVPGTWRTLLVTQPSAGTAVLTFGNQWKFPAGVVPVIATGNAALTRLMLYCRSTSIFECYMTGAGLA